LRFTDVGRFGEKAIITTTRSSGTRQFTSIDDGVGGRHHIDIIVTRHGLPQTILTAGSFVVPRPPTPSKPRAVRLRRKGNAVVLTWARAPRALLYAVLITTTDGRRKFYALQANQRMITLQRVFAPDSITARIQTVAADGLESPPTTTKLRLTNKR
jgi:hypothetical protein